ncbi:twin-arginine translocase TatA/TatE family subunit [uncultured Sphingomonas sp.]|uniref:Sec-independent protein translocase subunit TatA/TatB n=1 Tax=uncultured Sphingomonas sp. TaxID=158754 RepID=UPI0035CC8B9A
MFDVAPTELIVLGTVALLVIPPKDLPRAMRTAGYWIGRARGVARQFRSGFDTMVRDAELAEMEQRWKAENERIMRDHPPTRAEAVAIDGPAAADGAPVMTAQPRIDDAPAAVSTIEHPVTVESPTVVPAESGTEPAADTKAPS